MTVDPYNVAKDVLTSNWSIGMKVFLVLLAIGAFVYYIWATNRDKERERLHKIELEKLRAQLEREKDELVKKERDAAWEREWANGVKRRLNDLTPLAKDILLEMETTKYPLILDNITASSFTVGTKVYIGKTSRYENAEKMDISTAIQTLIDGALVVVDAASSPYPGITNRTVYRLTKSGAQLARDARELGKIQK